MIIRIESWGKYQHYKDRSPPWIKLYRNLLDLREYRELTDFQVRLLVDIWLLMAEAKTHGELEIDSELLAWRLRYKQKDKEIDAALKVLETKGFIEIASGMLAECKQVATPETEKRESREQSTEKRRFVPPSIEDVTEYCLERGRGVDPEKWYDHYTAKGWKIGTATMKDWRAAVRTWERNLPTSASASPTSTADKWALEARKHGVSDV